MHGQEVAIGIGTILILGILAQWIGWRMKLPPILPLLILGFLAGPVTGLLHPDEILGDLLFPFVSISVAVILFEGGLSLKKEEVIGVRKVVQLLITVGALITWLSIGAAAYYILGLSLRTAALLGAILVVTGPTVVIPLLRTIRPVSRVRSVLQWEGILIDPVGATLAVLVLGGIVSAQPSQFSVLSLVGGMVLTLIVGTAIGVLAAYIILLLFQNEWVTEYLHTAVALMFVVGAYLLANSLRTEAGLMATTVMGIILANQKRVSISHIVTFKEELGIVLLSVLFIILSARIELTALTGVGLEVLLFLAAIIFIIRPLAVWVSTLRSQLSWQERTFIAYLAPRGIVAASVASLFALELEELNIEGAEELVPLTFIVVVGTVVVYALTSGLVANYLGLVQTNPQGTLIVGAHGWAREIASAIQDAGFDVWLVDTNSANVQAARMEGLRAFQGSILSENVVNRLPLAQIGRMLALTSNIELNALAGLAMRNYIDKDKIFLLTSSTEGLTGVKKQFLTEHMLFGDGRGYEFLDQQFASGGNIYTRKIAENFDFEKFKDEAEMMAVPLFILHDGSLEVIGANSQSVPQPGEELIILSLPAFSSSQLHDSPNGKEQATEDLNTDESLKNS